MSNSFVEFPLIAAVRPGEQRGKDAIIDDFSTLMNDENTEEDNDKQKNNDDQGQISDDQINHLQTIKTETKNNFRPRPFSRCHCFISAIVWPWPADPFCSPTNIRACPSFSLSSLNVRFVFRAEYNAFWKCVQSAASYLFVQFLKMLTIATCFPPVDESSAFVVKTVRRSLKLDVTLSPSFRNF